MTSPLAGKPAPPELLIDVPRLIAAYYTEKPDPTERAQQDPAIAGHPSMARLTRITFWRSVKPLWNIGHDKASQVRYLLERIHMPFRNQLYEQP